MTQTPDSPAAPPEISGAEASTAASLPRLSPPWRHQLSRLRSYLLLDPLIFAWTGLMGSASFAASFLDSDGELQHVLARRWAQGILRMAGIPVRVVGHERIPSAPAVYAVNHLSAMDIPVLYAALPFSFRIVAKKELWRTPFIGGHLRRSGQIPVDASNPRASLRSLHKAVESLQTGHPLVIFPEGGRSPDGRLMPFMNGPFYMAIKAQVPVVPLALIGTFEVLPMNTFHIMPGPVTLAVGQPISSAGMALRDMEALASATESSIANLAASNASARQHPPSEREL